MMPNGSHANTHMMSVISLPDDVILKANKFVSDIYGYSLLEIKLFFTFSDYQPNNTIVRYNPFDT